jgi:hypothetical protein
VANHANRLEPDQIQPLISRTNLSARIRFGLLREYRMCAVCKVRGFGGKTGDEPAPRLVPPPTFQLNLIQRNSYRAHNSLAGKGTMRSSA